MEAKSAPNPDICYGVLVRKLSSAGVRPTRQRLDLADIGQGRTQMRFVGILAGSVHHHREMIALVRTGSASGWPRLIAAVEEALRLGVSDAAAVTHIMNMPDATQRKQHAIALAEELAQFERPMPSMDDYDLLLTPSVAYPAIRHGQGDPSPADHDDEIVMPQTLLAQKQTIEQSKLPFAVKIDAFYLNSTVKGPMESGPKDARATAGNRS